MKTLKKDENFKDKDKKLRRCIDYKSQSSYFFLEFVKMRFKLRNKNRSQQPDRQAINQL